MEADIVTVRQIGANADFVRDSLQKCNVTLVETGILGGGIYSKGI